MNIKEYPVKLSRETAALFFAPLAKYIEEFSQGLDAHTETLAEAYEFGADLLSEDGVQLQNLKTFVKHLSPHGLRCSAVNAAIIEALCA